MLIPPPMKKPLRACHVSPAVALVIPLGVGRQRCDRSVDADHGAEGSDGVPARHRAVELERSAQRAARADGRADSPAERPAGNLEVVGAAAELPPGVARHLDAARRVFLAEDGVDDEIGASGAGARVVVPGRRLEHAAQSDGRRLLAVLGPEVELGAEVEVADVIAAPSAVHARIAIDDAAVVRIVD